MADFNNVTFTGRLTKNPELRYLVDGTAITRFSIAVNGWKDGDVTFINCVAFKKTAEVAGEYCKKGKQVLVNGSLKVSSFEGDDGAKKTKHEVIVNNLQLLGGKAGE